MKKCVYCSALKWAEKKSQYYASSNVAKMVLYLIMYNNANFKIYESTQRWFSIYYVPKYTFVIFLGCHLIFKNPGTQISLSDYIYMYIFGPFEVMHLFYYLYLTTLPNKNFTIKYCLYKISLSWKMYFTYQ